MSVNNENSKIVEPGGRRDSGMKTFKQFIGFCLVGASNVVINWIIYYLFIFLVANKSGMADGAGMADYTLVKIPFSDFLSIDYVGYVTGTEIQIATFLGFIVSMFNGFLLNYYFVFKARTESFWKALLRFASVYVATSYILTALITWGITSINLFGVGVVIAPPICTIINTPINFFFSKKWAFKKEDKE